MVNRFVISYIISGNEDGTYEDCLEVATEHGHSGTTIGEDLSARLLAHCDEKIELLIVGELWWRHISGDEPNGFLDCGMETVASYGMIE